jgi:type VI secretion system secreted protein Hcp
MKGFEKCTELMSYSHGVANFIQATTSNTGRTTGRPNVQEISVTKNLDAASPNLNFFCCNATNLGKTQLYLVRQDATADGKASDAIAYMVYELEDTMISSVSVGGGGGSIPMESVSLNFSKVTWTYGIQKKETGEGGVKPTSWNLTTNNPQ